METSKIKKDLQKTVKSIRDELNAAKGEAGKKRCLANEIPKAMMTAAQMEKGTATVNCGAGWFNATQTGDLASKVYNSPYFKEFLTRANATAKIESVAGSAGQVRIYY